MSKNDLPQELNASAVGQINQMVQAGLPIETGLRALAEQTKSALTKAGLLELSRRLEQGIPLATALQGSDFELPESMKALVQAGIKAGRLDSIMQYSIEQAQRAIYLRQQIWLTLSYPIFLFWFAALYGGASLIFLVPSFRRIFDDFGTELPGMTVLLIQMSSALRINGLGESAWAIIFLLGLIASVSFILVGFSQWMKSRATSIPVIGPIFRFAALSDFCQILALLVETGMPFPTALQFAGNASGDRWLNQKSQVIVAEIELGSTPEDAARHAELPGMLVQIFHNSNSKSALVETLRGLSDIYAAQSSLASQLVSSMIGPFTVIFVTFFVGFTVIALFMPLIKLLNDLS